MGLMVFLHGEFLAYRDTYDTAPPHAGCADILFLVFAWMVRVLNRHEDQVIPPPKCAVIQVSRWQIGRL